MSKILKQPTYLGRHTAASWLAETGKLKEVCPMLAMNEGKLPPFIMFFGDRRRVIATAQHLNLRDTVRLDLESEKQFGLDGSGRVNLVIGNYGPEDKPIPLLLAETQMGCPSTQIIFREIVALASTNGYVVNVRDGERKIGGGSIFIIRAGTAGGINLYPNFSFTPKLAIGDVVVANETTGHIGAVFQSLGIIDPFTQMARRVYHSAFSELGIKFENGYPILPCSQLLIETLLTSSLSLGLTTYVGRNFSKDSLYAEANEATFVWFRNNLRVLSTEMEQVVIAYEAARCKKNYGIDIHTGLISAIIGLIPGGSFASGDDEKRAKIAEKSILTAAADALHIIAYPK